MAGKSPLEVGPDAGGWQFWYEDERGALRDGSFAASLGEPSLDGFAVSSGNRNQDGFAVSSGNRSLDALAVFLREPEPGRLCGLLREPKPGRSCGLLGESEPGRPSWPPRGAGTWERQWRWQPLWQLDEAGPPDLVAAAQLARSAGGWADLVLRRQTRPCSTPRTSCSSRRCCSSAPSPCRPLCCCSSGANRQGLENRGGLIIGTAVVARYRRRHPRRSHRELAGGDAAAGVPGCRRGRGDRERCSYRSSSSPSPGRRTAGMGTALGIGAGAGFAVAGDDGVRVLRAGVSRRRTGGHAGDAPAAAAARPGQPRRVERPRRLGLVADRLQACPTVRGQPAWSSPSRPLSACTTLWDLSSDLTPHIALAVVSVAILITLMILSARRDRARHAPRTAPQKACSHRAGFPQQAWAPPITALPVQSWAPVSVSRPAGRQSTRGRDAGEVSGEGQPASDDVDRPEPCHLAEVAAVAA